jgi:hypothetical protein
MKKMGIYLLFIYLSIVVSIGLVLADSLGDPFDGNDLKNPKWEWQDEPDEWDIGKTTEGWLHIVPNTDQNLWASDTSIRLYQETTLDKFDIETHAVIDYQATCVVGGLVVLGPTEDNWTTLKFWGRADDAILQWQHKQQEVVGNVPNSSQPAGRVEAYLRMAKDGDNYMGWWKKEEQDDWIEIKPDAPITLTPPIQVGVFAGICTNSGEAIIEYEYFKDNINPFPVEPTGKLSTTWGQVKSNYIQRDWVW